MKLSSFALTAIVFSISLHFLACTKEPSITAPSQYGIYGSWQWEKSVGGILGDIRTPSSAGYTNTIVFKNDATFEYYRNDTLLGVSRFTVKREKTFFGPEIVDVIHYENDSKFMPQIITLIGKDTLALTDLCVDCFGHRYARIK